MCRCVCVFACVLNDAHNAVGQLEKLQFRSYQTGIVDVSCKLDRCIETGIALEIEREIETAIAREICKAI